MSVLFNAVTNLDWLLLRNWDILFFLVTQVYMLLRKIYFFL